ncbi:MAG: hypothetical protein ACYC33_11480 [Thermoleophilia bacterium]
MTESQVLSRSISGEQATFAPDLPVWVADFEHALERLLGPRTRTHFLSDAPPSLWHAQVPSTPDRSDGNGDRTVSRAAAIQAAVETLNASSPGALEQPPADFDSVFDAASNLREDAAARTTDAPRDAARTDAARATAARTDAARADALRVAEYCGLLSDLLKFGAGWDPAGPISRGDAVSVEIDGSAMRTVIAKMRAGRNAKKSKETDDTAGGKAAVRRPSTRVRGTARGGARESVRDRAPS